MSAEELLSKHQKAAKAAVAMTKLKDPKEILEAAGKLAEMAKELMAAGKRLEAQYAVTGGPEERVVLTPDQRERIAESTGVALDMVVVRDSDGSFARKMPVTDRATIERLAARQAGVIAGKKAKEKAVEDLIKKLQKMDEPSLDPIIEALRKDPSLVELAEKQKVEGEEATQKAEAAGGGGQR